MGSFFDNLDWSWLLNRLVFVIPALICITIHELSHGYVAYRLGDRTAKEMGRLTFNPIRHIDIFGFLMLVSFGFGWAKPVPINMMNFKKPKQGMAISALAGPVSNMILAAVFAFVYGALYPFIAVSPVGSAVLKLIYATIYINIALAIFNLIPIPPLDGSKVLFSLVSDEFYFKLMRYERYGMLILLVVVATGILGNPLASATEFILGKLSFIAQAGSDLFGYFA